MKTRNILLIVLSTCWLSSCNYLDFDETSDLKTKEEIYKYFRTVEQMLTTVYYYLPQDLGVIGGAMRDCATDDAEYAATGASIQSFNNGSWSPINTIDSQWGSSWSLYWGIRAANGFIADVENVDLSRFENDINYQQMMTKLKYFPYEARLLRAYFFFELARRYGDIAMPLTVLTTGEANQITKTNYQDVIRFIADECDAVAPNLPVTYKGVTEQTGRVTRGFAMALKSKALLYAASPLHNSANNADKWKASAKAALDLIDMGVYALDKTEAANNLVSKEVVMFRLNSFDSKFELNNFPIRFTVGQRSTPASATFPSQNLVDAFETIGGYSVTLTESGWVSEDPGFDPSHPYANRDPRMARAVLTDGSLFKGSSIETFIGGKDDIPVTSGGSATGYFLRKYIQEVTDFTPDKLVKKEHLWVIYRYAETLLTYAESMIEAFGDANYTDQIYNKSALWAINEVRINAGMPLVKFIDKDDFIRKVRNEWRVEFAFEDHRFWDIRRWKIGDKTQRELYGVSIEKKADGNKVYQRILHETRKWSERMNLYPIPQDELFKNKNLLPQNTGW